MYKNKMLEENKKSENISGAYSDEIQVRQTQFKLISSLTYLGKSKRRI